MSRKWEQQRTEFYQLPVEFRKRIQEVCSPDQYLAFSPMILKKKKKKKEKNPLYFVLGYSQLTMLIVPDEQQRDSTIHSQVSILSQTPLPSRLSYNIEQSSMCHTIGPCWLSILIIALCVHTQSRTTLWKPMD